MHTYDRDKVDEAVLALLHLTSFSDKYGASARTTHELESLHRLHEQGYIGLPSEKHPQVVLTTKGQTAAKRLFEKLFGRDKRSV